MKVHPGLQPDTSHIIDKDRFKASIHGSEKKMSRKWTDVVSKKKAPKSPIKSDAHKAETEDNMWGWFVDPSVPYVEKFG